MDSNPLEKDGITSGGVNIHRLACVDPRAELGKGVWVGPFAVIEAGVGIGDECRIEAHAVIKSGTVMGARNTVHSHAVLGGAPQDLKHKGGPSRLEIGSDNTFREHFTAHRGTDHGGLVTRIGDHGFFMAGSHVGHDAQVGSHVTMANQTLLAGHSMIGDCVVTGGHTGVAPFVRVGRHVFLAAGALVEQNIPPFVIAAGDRARVRALNKVGLLRRNVPESSRMALDRAFRAIFRGGTPRRVAARALLEDVDAYVRELAAAVVGEAA